MGNATAFYNATRKAFEQIAYVGAFPLMYGEPAAVFAESVFSDANAPSPAAAGEGALAVCGSPAVFSAANRNRYADRPGVSEPCAAEGPVKSSRMQNCDFGFGYCPDTSV